MSQAQFYVATSQVTTFFCDHEIMPPKEDVDAVDNLIQKAVVGTHFQEAKRSEVHC